MAEINSGSVPSSGAQNGMVQDGMAQSGAMGNGGMNPGMQGMGMQPGMMSMPKPPMDPAKKKKIILGVSLGVGGVMLAIIGIVVASIVLSPNYGESYKVAKELRSKISVLDFTGDCQDVVDYVNSTYTSVTDYDRDVDSCKTSASEVPGLVVQLGQTSGVKRDKEVKAQFERFQEALNSILPDQTDLETRLGTYSAWHKFVVAVDDLTANDSDAEFQNAAKKLTESGNEVLAKYGAGWLEKELAWAKAYRAWDNASYSASNYSALRQARDDTKAEASTWIAENKPDINEVGGLDLQNNDRMATEFNKLYDMIVELYEQNYDGSGECSEFLGDVYCE